MNEFNSFNSKDLDESNSTNLENQETFKSDLGDFTHLQDRIIKFGQSNLMMLLTILIIAVFIIGSIVNVIYMTTDLSFESYLQTLDYNRTKIIIVLIFGLSLILPLAASFITYGCKKLKVDFILKGMKFAILFININYIILTIAIIFLFIWFLPIIPISIILVLLTGLIIGGLIYLYIVFLAKCKVFITDLANSFSNDSESTFLFELTPEKLYPKASKLRPFFIGLLILSIISWLFTFGQNNDDIAQISPDIAAALDKIDFYQL